MEIETRWMRRDDVPDAVRLMRVVGEGETEKGLNRMLEKSSVACVVAVNEDDDKVVGFLMYDVARVSKIKILSLVVDEQHRRLGVGGRLASLAISKLNPKRSKAELGVSEYNLDAQLFLKSMGFRAVSVVNRPPEPSEYKFVYRFSQMVEEPA